MMDVEVSVEIGVSGGKVTLVVVEKGTRERLFVMPLPTNAARLIGVSLLNAATSIESEEYDRIAANGGSDREVM